MKLVFWGIVGLVVGWLLTYIGPIKGFVLSNGISGADPLQKAFSTVNKGHLAIVLLVPCAGFVLIGWLLKSKAKA